MTAAERFVKRMLTAGEEGKADGIEKVMAVSPDEESGDAVKPIQGKKGELAQRESALEVALNYLQNEGDQIERNPFSKGWAIKDGYGRDGKPLKPAKANKSEKSAKDELIEALVEDAAPKEQTLEQHDRQHHPRGFNPETDTCKFRERIATETETDKGDILDTDIGGDRHEIKRDEQDHDNKKGAEPDILDDFGNPRIKTKPVRIGRGFQIPLVRAFDGIKDESGQLRYVSLSINEDPSMRDGDVRVQYDDSLNGAMFLYIKDPDSLVKTVYNENGTYHHGELLVDKISDELKRGLAHFSEKVKGAGKQDKGESPSKETSNDIVSPEGDKKYLDAVERGDMKTAQKMVDAVAKRFLSDSAVQEKVWHNTKKKFTEFKNSFPNVFFFAKDKKWADKFGEDARSSKPENSRAYYVAIKKPIDMSAEKSGKEWLSYFAEQGVKIGGNGKEKLEGFGDRVIPGYAILNHDSAEPYGTGYRDAMVKAGFDGAILEDIKRGNADRTTYGAFYSRDIKSADAVTYDDNGNVIPLSRRFDEGVDIRGDISGNPSEQQNEKTKQDNTGAFSKEDPDIRHSISDDAKEPQQQFSKEFWAEVHPERGSSYSSEFGEDAGEQERKDMETYKANFTKDGKYKVPFANGKFSKEIIEKAKNERENGSDGVWTAESRAEAEAAGRVLSNLLGGENMGTSRTLLGV